MNLVLTKNFYTWMRNVLLQTATSITTATISAKGHDAYAENVVGKFINTDGVEQTTITLGGTSNLPCSSSLNAWSSGTAKSSYYTYFEIGSNNAEPTADDYCLSSYTMGTDYTASWRALSNPTMVNDKAQLVFNVSITAKNDISVGEIGLFKQIKASSSSTACFLFGRVALDTPVELSAGESATFQVTIEI